MKKIALLAAAAALITAGPAMAEGYVGLQYGNGNIDAGASTDTTTWQAEGSVGFGASANWGTQFDLAFGNVDVDAGGDANYWTGAAHLFYKADSWRLGAVVATTQIDDSGSSDEWAYGVEGTYNFTPNMVFIGSGTLGSVDGDVDLWNIDGGLNFYSGDNVRFGGNLGFGNIDSAGGVDTLSWGLNGEFQPWSAPVSLTLGYNHFSIDDANLDSQSFTVGARWNFGGGTLRDRDNAAPFNTNTGYLDRFFTIF